MFSAAAYTGRPISLEPRVYNGQSRAHTSNIKTRFLRVQNETRTGPHNRGVGDDWFYLHSADGQFLQTRSDETAFDPSNNRRRKRLQQG